MNVCLIGASGFVGTRLIKHLQENSSHGLLNIDKQDSPFFSSLTRIADVRDYPALEAAMAGSDLVVLLAAEHRDDVSPVELYYDVNVQGMRHTLQAMEKNGLHRLVFFSSVAVYGLNKPNPDETFPADPFNHYGKSKWQAEQVLQEWYATHPDWNINILRPTVIFGERNRGNVYNLLSQIASGRFMMVGKGENVKSMAYVGNVVAFAQYLIDHETEGYNVFNYVDKPDFTMNRLIALVSEVMHRRLSPLRLPYALGMVGGYCFDALAWLLHRKLRISSVRVKKFCAVTCFDSAKMRSCFKPPFSLEEGLQRTLEFEFIHPKADNITFESE